MEAQERQHDPPVPPDGSCYVCGKPRHTRPLKALYERAMLTDPFCSMPCAREWWGTTLPSTKREDLTDGPRGIRLPP